MARKKAEPKKTAKPNNNAYIEGAGLVADEKITMSLEKNYMPYAMSVLVSRAFPEIDGFKPSHRKLLYTMYKMGLLNGKLTKSANIVGATMRLNPHGERDGGEQEQNTDDNLYEHSGFRLPHTRNALALVGLGLALCGLASFRLLFLNVLLLIDTMLADVAPGLGIISAALVRVELPPALHASNNMLFHGMSNSLLFFRSADL